MPMPSTALESARLQPADLCTCHDNNNNNNNINYLTTILLQQLQQHASRGHMSPVGLPKRHPPKRSSLRPSPDPLSMQSCRSHCRLRRRLLGRAAVSVAIISNDKLDCTAQSDACWQLAGLSRLGQFNRKMIDDREQRLEMGSYAT